MRTLRNARPQVSRLNAVGHNNHLHLFNIVATPPTPRMTRSRARANPEHLPETNSLKEEDDEDDAIAPSLCNLPSVASGEQLTSPRLIRCKLIPVPKLRRRLLLVTLYWPPTQLRPTSLIMVCILDPAAWWIILISAPLHRVA
jgi:hypothetical protein